MPSVVTLCLSGPRSLPCEMGVMIVPTSLWLRGSDEVLYVKSLA